MYVVHPPPPELNYIQKPPKSPEGAGDGGAPLEDPQSWTLIFSRREAAALRPSIKTHIGAGSKKNKNNPPPSNKVPFVRGGPCPSTSRCHFVGLGQVTKGPFLSFNHYFYPFGVVFFTFFIFTFTQ